MSFAYGTQVMGPEGFRPIESYAVGDEAMGADMAGQQPVWTPQIVAFSNGVPPNPHEDHMVYLTYGEAGAMTVTLDQSFLLMDGALKGATYLERGDELVGADGGAVLLTQVAVGRFQGGVHAIALAPMDWSGSADGHLLNAGGLVAGDYIANQHALEAGQAKGGSSPEQRPLDYD
ncbi:MAG TPA: hypothetical protein VIT45_15575 [Allosphingosinicella sp.]